MADNIKYRFIQNVGDFFPAGYFGEDFIDKVIKVADYSADHIAEICSKYVQFRRKYDDYKNRIVTQTLRPKDSIRYTHDFHTELLKLLGYGDLGTPYSEQYVLDDDKLELIPVRHVLRRNNSVQMLVMEMRPLIKVGDEEPAGLFEQQYDDESLPNKPSRFNASHWSEVFTMPEGYKISPAVVNKAVSRIFLLPEDRRPSYILMCAGNTLFLFDKEKWNRGSYLSFTLDDLFSQASISAFRKYYALFHLLICKETLSPDGETILMDSLVEDSYKNAYEVTKDLKEGVVDAVETLANEALWFWQHLPEDSDIYNPVKTIDYTDDTFEAQVKDDCLTIIYRLLFLFYAESRTELEILPVGDEVYERGYSLEMLRDLEQVHLISEESKRGYFIDCSLKKLFKLLSGGHKENQSLSSMDRSFRVRHIDSPMFDDRKLHHLGQVKFRNEEWKKIICALSLSKKKQGKGRGRISYANLGVNQLGSVYESLLAYRGFYAEENYIEVHKDGHPEDGTFLVPYSRMEDFHAGEILRNDDNSIKILPRGTFVYRLNGRDRQKSASYYTPEVLTRSTVKYTLKAIIDDVREGKRKALELLDLKILEPAMGAAAFQNEVINQLAEAYLQYRQEEKKREYMERKNLTDDQLDAGSWRIAPDAYRDELQKVKAYIATHNVYGVDLNPTAIELGKLSLWLNVIHKDMETPFFSNRLALGNAVVGAWLKVYRKEDVYGIKGKKSGKQVLLQNKWWEKAPHKVSFQKNSVKRSVNEIYHFLLPDDGMLGVRTIKDYKDKAKQERDNERTYGVTIKPISSALEGMKSLIADWTKPINDADFRRLQRISSKIDVLLFEYFKFQRSVEDLTQNKMALWGVPGNMQTEAFLSEKYEIKQQLNDARYRHDNAYFRLKMVMDYWCSLWFWNLEDAGDLPNREQYWNDIEAMLDVSDEKLDTRIVKAINKATVDEPDLFAMVSEDIAEYNAKPTEQESEIIRMSKEEILENVQGEATTFFDNSLRFKIVKRLADRYHFFHPMLEFLEVFWLRDGFDIICGNPPWVLPTFDVIGVFSDKFPEVVLKGLKAPAVRADKDSYFAKCNLLENIYNDELINSTCTNVFTNSACCYPYLVGVQTDLYMCILESSFMMISDKGYIGMIHPESVYDTAKLDKFRGELYHRLQFHFQYQNEKHLFAEVHNETTFSVNIYGKKNNNIDFLSIHNLFTPNTVDASFVHDGHGYCHGIKKDDQWNIEPHKERIVHFNEGRLKLLSETFETDKTTLYPKLINVQSSVIVDVIYKLSQVTSYVKDFDTIITTGFHETGAVDEGLMKRVVSQPSIYDDIILNGPIIHVSTPCYKMPRTGIKSNKNYDTINLMLIPDNFVPATCFSPSVSHEEFKKTIKGFVIYYDNKLETNVTDCWLDHYKLGMSEWVGSASLRTLSSAILTPGTHHIGTIVSIIFRDNKLLVELAGLTSSLPLDFFMKVTGASHVKQYRIESFPLGIADKFKPALFARTLMLNCLTTAYTDLWQEMWDGAYKNETWSKDDSRLKSFAELHNDWAWDIPLRNYYERRQALVEIDVISAMALGLTLEDLEMIYTIQFPVLQQNENDTWYDAEGKIVFTCSKGLTGVGLDRKPWEAMRGEEVKDEDGNIIAYKGNEPTYLHTIDPAKSELYGGQQQTFIAPYTKCDRIQDYRTAWAHFEKIFNKD